MLKDLCHFLQHFQHFIRLIIVNFKMYNYDFIDNSND